MSGYSSTGQWVVRTGGRLIGPMDGLHPAKQLARELRLAGYDAELERLWSLRDLRAAMAAPAKRAEMRHNDNDNEEETP